MDDALITVIETNPFLSDCKGILSDEERADVVDMIAANPMCGVAVSGTGGIRKVRIPLGNGGKSGGARVLYFYSGADLPVFLLTIFAKNEKANISKGEANTLKAMTLALKNHYRKE